MTDPLWIVSSQVTPRLRDWIRDEARLHRACVMTEMRRNRPTDSVPRDPDGLPSSAVARHVRRRPIAAVVRLFVVAVTGALVLAVVFAGPARSPGGFGRILPLHQKDRVPAAIAAPPDSARSDRASRDRRPQLTASPSPTATFPPSRSAKPATAGTAPAPTISERTRVENAVASRTNAERDKAGCPALRIDERLRQAARGHSEDMAERNYFSHDSPEGTTPWDRAKAAGYRDPSGENIARGYPDASSVVEAWMNSPGHRANILNCDSMAIGVGVDVTADSGPYWTQMFGYS